MSHSVLGCERVQQRQGSKELDSNSLVPLIPASSSAVDLCCTWRAGRADSFRCFCVACVTHAWTLGGFLQVPGS